MVATGEAVMQVVRALVLAMTLLSAGSAFAQTYPDRAIRILVGFTPGSATDISGRMFAQKLGEALNATITVENIPGGGGGIAAERVARSAPDGYTLYWGANGALTINPSLLPNNTLDPLRDLAPVARLLVAPSILAVNNDVPVKSVQELIALAKQQPGKLTYASPGVGTPQHIAGEVLKGITGIDIVHVPYRGANFTDVIGGRIPITMQNAGAILPTVRDGKLRALAMTARTRSPNMPEYPTMIEAGVPDFEVTSWFGLLAPAGTPAPIVSRLNAEMVKVLARPDVKSTLGAQGLEVSASSPDQFAAHIKSEIARFTKIARAAGIKAE